jgi:hypothetical protein
MLYLLFIILLIRKWKKRKKSHVHKATVGFPSTEKKKKKEREKDISHVKKLTVPYGGKRNWNFFEHMARLSHFRIIRLDQNFCGTYGESEPL